jgi:hypothetical protein
MDAWIKFGIILFFLHVLVNLIAMAKLENIREQLKAIMKHYKVKDGEI